MSQLLILDGPQRGQRCDIGQSLTIGRRPGNDLQLSSMAVSRFHAKVERREDGYWLKDVGSASGTWVNWMQVRERRLNDGDEIRVGDVLLRFVVQAPQAPAEPPPEVTETVESTQPMDQDIPLRFGMRASTPREAYDEILRYLLTIVPAERGAILLIQPGTGELVTSAIQVMDSSIDAARRFSQPLIQQVLQRREAVYSPSRVKQGPPDARQGIQAGDTMCAICAPLLARDGELLGVIYLDSWGFFHQLDERQLPWISSTAGPAARAVERWRAMSKTILGPET